MISVAALCILLLHLSPAYSFPFPFGTSPSGASPARLNPYPTKPRLVFQPRHDAGSAADKSFTVAVFADLHFGEGEEVVWGPEQDVNSTRVMNHVLDDERPDFVAFSGDQITGENTFKENSTSYLSQVFGPVSSRKIPFSSTYGNHDNDVNISHALSLAYERNHFSALSYTRSEVGDPNYGLANYWVPIYSDPSSAVPSLLIWFFDSRSGRMYGKEGGGQSVPDWVEPAVVPSWINSTVQQMISTWSFLPPSLVFVHIPTHEALDLQNSLGPLLNSSTFPGINDDKPPSVQNTADGSQGSPSGVSTGGGQGEDAIDGIYRGRDREFWYAVTGTLDKSDGVVAVVSGHDHGDGWCARSQAIKTPICFARHSGYGGYGSWARGSRIFQFSLAALQSATAAKRKPSVKSWVRMEDHSVIDGIIIDDSFGM